VSTVPWIRLYQNWPRHRKTKALRKALGTAEPILCLWLWAAENAPDGDLFGMDADDIEDAAEWKGKRGKAFEAMVEVQFIDVDESGTAHLHNWVSRAGAGVANLERRRERARERMRDVRANRTRTERERACEQDANAVSANIAETLSLSLDPDLGTYGSGSVSAIPDQSNQRAKSAYDWLSCFNARFFASKGKQRGSAADAKATANLQDQLNHQSPGERAEDWGSRERIVDEFLSREDRRTVEAGWQFAFFVSSFDGLRISPDKRPKTMGQRESIFDEHGRLKAVHA
jgi:hypothetical protein